MEVIYHLNDVALYLIANVVQFTNVNIKLIIKSRGMLAISQLINSLFMFRSEQLKTLFAGRYRLLFIRKF